MALYLFKPGRVNFVSCPVDPSSTVAGLSIARGVVPSIESCPKLAGALQGRDLDLTIVVFRILLTLSDASTRNRSVIDIFLYPEVQIPVPHHCARSRTVTAKVGTPGSASVQGREVCWWSKIGSSTAP
jgi:hypothetical protein